MMSPAVHLHFQVVANLVYQINLKKWFASNEVPYHTLLLHLVLMAEDIVYGLLCHLPRHPLLGILPHQVAILASQLAVLGDNEGDVLGVARLPRLTLVLILTHQIQYVEKIAPPVQPPEHVMAQRPWHVPVQSP